MFEYFGKKYAREDIAKFSGSMAQIAGIKNYEYSDGRAKGVSASDVKTGAGLVYTVTTGRGMDLICAEYKGINLAHITEAGVVNPAFFEEQRDEWMRSFAAGMLTTCGINQVGEDCEYNGSHYPLHGRIGNLPAQNIATDEYFDNDGNYVMTVSGEIKQAKQLAEALVLKRKITSSAGKNEIIIADTYENRRFTPSPFMVLYHFNLGFPFLNEKTRILAKYDSMSSMFEGREEQAKKALCAEPIAETYDEQVFFFELVPDKDGMCHVLCLNDETHPEIGIKLSFAKEVLPRLAVWKQMSYGDYIMGVEPTNCHVLGVAEEERKGTLLYLGGREQIEIMITFSVLTGGELLNEISAY